MQCKTRIYVLGNCQTNNLAFFLSYLSPNIQAIPIEVWNLYQTKPIDIIDYYKQDIAKQEVIVLTQNIYNKNYDFFTTDNIMALKKDRAFRITNFYFTGVFPDIIYIGNSKQRITSVLGDYNSNIVFNCFLEKKTISECINLFNCKNFESLGYFEKWYKSADELIMRDHDVDIPFSHEFLSSMREHLCMYSINHPSSIILSRYAKKIIKHLGFSFNYYLPEYYVYDTLSHGPWCLVFEEIKEFFNLKYKTYPYFKDKQNNFYTLKQFITKSYELYKTQKQKINALLMAK